MVEIAQLTDVAVNTAKQAGNYLKQGFRSGFEIFSKPGKHNLVTTCDKESEKMIIEMIRNEYPTHSFLAEEGGEYAAEKSPYLWVIDPLDGTVNFAHGVPIFCVSIACTYEKEVVCGVVYQPVTDELFVAAKGMGSTLNNRPIHVSETKDLSEAFLVTGFPYNVHENPKQCIDTFSHLVKQGLPIRRLGSAALDASYLAAGRFDAFWEVSLEPWDIAAAKLIVEEAGGKVSHYDGTPHAIFEKGTVLASNGHLHAALQKELYATPS